ncbi:hypothetical protein RvY_16839 [Ramazzottius varieornatus]|uniref:Uncharacterized protein n=1 Tax=Ramazzottius varieornatus TaxID=947166 RepID=A0A1D1W0K9_RAMVA|nr:hypothetical protein RvY_16839 [Ramazzottius varieornatus]
MLGGKEPHRHRGPAGQNYRPDIAEVELQWKRFNLKFNFWPDCFEIHHNGGYDTNIYGKV